MKQYKGYYITESIGKAEIDAMIKENLIRWIRIYSTMLFDEEAIAKYGNGGVMKISQEISIREEELHNEYGMSWEEIEELPFTA